MSITTEDRDNDFAGSAEATVVVTRPGTAGSMAVPHPGPATPAISQRAPYGGFPPYAGAQPGGWSGGFPPGHGSQGLAPAGTPAPRRGLGAMSRNARVVGVVAAAAAVRVAVAGVVVIGGHAGGDSPATPSLAPTASSAAKAAEPPAVMVTAADLPKLLLSPAEEAAAVGLPGSERDAKTGPVNSVPFVDRLETNEAACLAMAYPAQQQTFQGTGFSAMRSQVTSVRIPNSDPVSWFISESVFAYPSVDAAQKAASKNVSAWKACEGQSWSQPASPATGGQPVFWNAGTVDDDGSGLVTSQATQENAAGWGCWRGLKVQANVVMDFSVCALNKPASTPAAIAAAISAKIPTA